MSTRSTPTTPPTISALGLDIGGSRTRALLTIDGVTVAQATGDSASWTAAGSECAEQRLSAIVDEVRGDRMIDAVCAGAAGSSTPAAKSWLHATLARLTGAPRVEVVKDAELILPAAGHATGIAVISGTGSIVHGQRGSRTARAGGWGYLLGDDFSGYWLVRAALRVLLSRRDRHIPLGRLGDALTSAITPESPSLDDLLSDLYRDPAPQHWAAYAPKVLNSDDAELPVILGTGAAKLAATATTVARSLGDHPIPVVIAGGFAEHDLAYSHLHTELSRQLPGYPIERLSQPPVAGAAARARAAALTI